MNVLSIGGFVVIHCSSDERAPCQMIGASLNTAGTLVNGCYGHIIKQHVLDAGYFQMVKQIILHFITSNPHTLMATQNPPLVATPKSPTQQV